MKVLFLGQRKNSHEDVELILEGVFGLEFDWATNLRELMEKCKDSNQTLPIVTESEEGSIIKILEEIGELDLRATPIVISRSPGPLKSILKGPGSFIILGPSPDRSDIENAIENATNMSKEKSSKRYFPIKISRFLKFNNVCSDVYIKISDQKFVKIINKDELYDSGLVNKYKEKEVTEFYVKKSDFESFFKNFQNILRIELSRKNENEKDKLGVQLSAVSFIHEAIESLNFSKDIIELADNVAKSNIALVKKVDNHIFELLNSLMQNKEFLYKHSLMTSYISIEIARKMNWSSNNTFEKLSLASMLHDIYLDNELAETHDLSPVSISGLDWRKTKRIKDHSFRLAQKVRTSEGFPPDLDNIILNHHELPDGSGYPRGLSATNISSISCIFILAEHLTKILLSNKDIIKDKSELKNNFKDFKGGNFRKPLEGLLKIIS
jgi:HD-GYP domain-containing protein (c-di-GMP phosphodiesterase class II)